MRRLSIWLVSLGLLLLLLPQTVAAQGATISLQAEALYDGTSKYGEWLPVVVELSNSGNDVRGHVAVAVSGSGQETAYAQQVELPRGARKQVTVYVVPNNFSRRLNVSFVAEGQDKPLAEQQVDVRPVPNIRFIAAVISGGGDGMEPLAGVNFRGERQNDRAVIVPLSLATLPERPEALRTLDMLVLTGVDSSELTPRQSAALEQYVALGGALVLGGGPEAGRVLAGIPASLRPVTLSGERALEALESLGQLTGEPVRVNGPFPAAVGEPVEGATVRLAEGELPLLVEQEVGEGVVYWLALDPALSPFDAWAGAGDFWQAVLGERAFYPTDLPPDMAPRQMANSDLFYALQNLPSLDLPSLQLLLPLLALYILAVGPVNYFVLRRQRRLELAWLTIPTLTLLFSAGTYGLGYQLRGSDVILNQVAIVHAVPNSETAYVRAMVGIFSPSRRSYDLLIGGEPLLSPPQGSVDPFSGNSNDQLDARLFQGQPALVEGLVVNQWSMKPVMAEALITNGYGYESSLETTSDKLVGTVTNRSDYTWEEVVVVLGSQFTRLGNIGPGESRELSLDTSVVSQGGADIAWRVFEQDFGPTGPNRQVQVRQQILSSLYNGPVALQFRQGPAGATAPVLLAWISEPPLDVQLGNQSRTSRMATTLLYSEMPVRFGAGQISLPRGMISSQVVENDGSTCYGPGSASLSPDFNRAEVRFELPEGVRGIDPSELSLYLASDGGWFAAPTLSLYDVEAEEWVELPEPVLGRNKVAEPDPYVSRDGTIRLLIENPDRNRGGCLFFDAALDGELAGSPQARQN